MAGKTLGIDMSNENLLPAWRTVVDLASSGISENWTLIGGLMVNVHARRAGVFMSRPTDDVDVLADYAASRSSLSDSQVALRDLDFTLSENEKHAYRFTHPDGRKLDLMVADHLPSRILPRIGGRPAFQATAGEQAIRRRDLYQLKFEGGTEVTIGVPDTLGALVAKGSAWLVDSRERERHLDDGAVLFACVGDASLLDYQGASKNDRKHIGALSDHLGNSSHKSWIGLEPMDREKGLFNLRLIRQALKFS